MLAPASQSRATLPWQYALVVGASSGIGAAMVRHLAQTGCHVAALARRGQALEAIAKDCNTKLGREAVLPMAHDVRDIEAVPALFQEITHRLGGLDLVVYAAGIMPEVGPEAYDPSKDRDMMLVNYVGATAWLGQAAARFGRVGRGTIIGISSIAGDRGRRGNPGYCASKAALNSYLESLRNRVGRLGVRVVTVKPGFVDTPMTQGKPGLFWLVSPEKAAWLSLRAAAKGRNVTYVPWRWSLVGFVIRAIPSFLFRHLNF